MTSLHFFSIPALNPEPFQATLNQFLAQHRVVSVEKQWLAAANHACWAICVTITGGQTELPAALKEPLPKPARETRIDYRETLSPDDFALYANLRTLRKNIAISEGVLPYALQLGR